MAINVRIAEKIEAKTEGREGMKDDILGILSLAEADRQLKKGLNKIMNNLK